MASNIGKIPILRAIQARGYAHAAPVSGLTNYDVKATTLPNKLAVVAADNGSQICRVSVLVKAGSRNECPDSLGAAHMLRIAAGLSTKNATQFAITRNIQQVGASLSCTVDRETVAYTLEGTREAVEASMPFLTEVSANQIFKPWELSDNIPRARYELATRPPQQRAIDLLHKAAYRRGLGNSIYLSKHQMGRINTETLQHFVAENFRSGRTAVVGLGVDLNSLSQYATSLQLPTGEGTNAPSPYKGGEIRSDKGGDLAFVAMALPTGGVAEQLQYSILAGALGSGPRVKYASGSGILGRSFAGENAAISAWNATYSDSGLFGVLIGCEARSAEKIVKGCKDVLKGIKVSEEDINRSKNQLKLELLTASEDGARAVEILGKQALLKGSVSSFSELASQIDACSSADISAAASKISSGKLSIVAVGNLNNVPFLDEL